MSRLGWHKKRLHEVVPDLEYVMKYTDQGPYPGNHWFWRDGRRNHGHDERGQAYLRWVVNPTAVSGWKTHGDFNVARLLIAARSPQPKGASFESQCGLSQCINPDHWRLVAAPIPWRMQVLESGVWQLVRVRTGAAAEREIVVRAAVAGVVHLAAIAPLALRTLAPPRAACGLVLPPAEVVVVVAASPSCAGCV